MLPAAAVAVGAMAPDLPLFVPYGPVTYQLTHTSVPASTLLALGLLALWYGILRPLVREGMPTRVARRIPVVWDDVPAPPRILRRWAAVITAAVIGVVTHLAWDAFTHEGRWGVRLLPALAEPWGSLPGYVWLQRGTGVAGVAILVVAAVRSWHHAPEAAPEHHRALPDAIRWVWWCALPTLLAGAWLAGLALWGPLTDTFTIRHLAYRTLPPAVGVWGALTVALCLGARLRGIIMGRRNRP